MSGSRLSLERAIRWYIAGGLFDFFSIGLAFLVIIALWNALSQGSDELRVQWMWIVLDSLLWPLYALQAAMHVVRDERTTVFEINLTGSTRVVFLGRLLAFVISQLVLGVPVLALFLSQGCRVPLSVILLKVLVFSSVVSLSILLLSRRSAFFLLVSFLILLPFSVPVIVNASISTTAPSGLRQLDPLTALVAVLFAPIFMYYKSSVLPFSYDMGLLYSSFISVSLILVAYFLFAEIEYNV